jgi:uncharacterized protein YecT (DUF1311 family)
MLAHGHGLRARAALLGLVLIFVAGCGNEPPGCADEKTVSLVKDVFWDSVEKSAADPAEKARIDSARAQFNVALQSPRLTQKQADAGKVVCAGTLSVVLTDAAAKTVDKLFRRSTSADVEYSSQITADGKQHYVELAGHDAPAEYVRSLVAMGAFDRPSAPPSPAAAAPTAQPPVAPAAARQADDPVLAATASGESESDPQSVANKEFEAADKALNEAYQAARASMSDPRKIALRDEQRAWIKRRDKACSEREIAARSNGTVTGGSAMETEQLSCKAKMSTDRAKQLVALRK